MKDCKEAKLHFVNLEKKKISSSIGMISLTFFFFFKIKN